MLNWLFGGNSAFIWSSFSISFCKICLSSFNRLREKFPPTAFAGRPPLSESGFNLLNRLLLYDPKKVFISCVNVKYPTFALMKYLINSVTLTNVHMLPAYNSWGGTEPWLVQGGSTSKDEGIDAHLSSPERTGQVTKCYVCLAMKQKHAASTFTPFL